MNNKRVLNKRIRQLKKTISHFKTNEFVLGLLGCREVEIILGLHICANQLAFTKMKINEYENSIIALQNTIQIFKQIKGNDQHKIVVLNDDLDEKNKGLGKLKELHDIQYKKLTEFKSQLSKISLTNIELLMETINAVKIKKNVKRL